MSLVSLADQYRVFVAYKDVFSGDKSRYRKMKKVQAEVERSGQQVSFQELVKDYGIDKIVSTARSLLARGIFESDLKAQILFSELYCTSDSLDSILIDLRKQPISNGSIALGHAKSDHTNYQEEHINKRHNSSLIRKSTKRDLRSQSESAPFRSTELPFRTQHIILAAVQRLLEECCFEFAIKWVPHILAGNQWDCAEAVELHKITAVLIDFYQQLPNGAILPSLSMSLKQILRSADNIRHSAVHRIRQTAPAVEKMIDVACQLAQALQDEQKLHLLQNLHQAILQAILRRNIEKSNLRQAFSQEQEDIKRLRHQLDRREEAALRSMISQDEEDSLSTALILEAAAKRILAPAAAEQKAADPIQITHIGNASEKSCSTTVSKNGDLGSAPILDGGTRLEAGVDASNSRALEDVIGDGDINKDEWDCVMAAVGLSQSHNSIAASPSMLRDTYARATELLGISDTDGNTEGQRGIQNEGGDISKKPSLSSYTSVHTDADAQLCHMARTADNKDIISPSQPVENTCMEMTGELTLDGEVNGCSGRRVACDDLEEMEQLMRCKRRRL